MTRRNGKLARHTVARTLRRAGVRLVMPYAEREEVSDGNAEHRDRYLSDWPDFPASVRALIEAGYSASDVAMFFGVSRERMRQLCDREGIERDHGARPRLWSDEERRFVPVSREEYARRWRELEEARRREERGREVSRRQEEYLAALERAAEKHGRTPTLQEVEEEAGVACQVVLQWFGAREGDYTYAEAARDFYALAGMEPREQGAYGHVQPDEATP